MNEEYTKYRISRNDELTHHGIAGQKWGKRNGPPYPLDYDDHSAREKKGDYRWDPDKDNPRKNKPLKNMTGKKSTDKAGLKSVYNEAKYVTAASKEITREREKASEKLAKLKERGNNDKVKAAEQREKALKDVENKAIAEAKRKQKELTNYGKEYASLYGDKAANKFSADSLNSMSNRKARRYIYNKGSTSMYLLGGIVGGGLKVSSNKHLYEAYKAELAGNSAASNAESEKSRNRDVASKAYTAYKIYKN